MTAPTSRPDAAADLSPDAPLAAADRELGARIARAWVLQHRPARSRAEVLAIAEELRLWQHRTSEQLIRRLGDPILAIELDAAAGPLVVPDARRAIPEQIGVIREQIEARVELLERFRAELPRRLGEEPTDELSAPRHHREPDPSPRATRAGSRARPAEAVLVLRAAASSTGVAVVGALGALGEGQPTEVVLDGTVEPGLAALPADGRAAAAVVVVEGRGRSGSPTTESALALGWATGALGPDRVLAVLAPGVTASPALGSLTVVPVRGRTRWRAEVVAWAAATTLG